MANNEPAKAGIELRRILQEHPNRADARYQLGMLLAMTGDVRGAEVELRHCVDLGYNKDIVYPDLARVLLLSGQPAKVVEQLSVHEPADPLRWANLKSSVAEALALTGKTEQAKSLVATILGRAPEHASTRLVEARLRVGARDPQGGLAIVDQVLARDANNRDALKLRGDIALFQMSDPARAIESYRRVVAVAPNWIDGHEALIAAEVFQGELAAAGKSLDVLRGLVPNHPQTRFLEAQLAFARQDYQGAREKALLLLKLAPQDVRLLQLAGAAELKLGRLSQAEAMLGKSVFIAPASPSGRRLLAAVLVRSGRPKKALEVLRPMLSVEPQDPEALSLAGEASVVEGQFEQAQSYFQRALKGRPADAKLRTSLALTYLNQGETARALSDLRAIAASSADTSADMILISQHIKRGAFDEAFKTIDALEAKTPDSATPAFLRGRLHAQRGEDAKARAAYDLALKRQPNYFLAVAGLSLLELKQGNPDAGRKRIEEFIKAEPANEQAWIALAAYAGRGRSASKDAQDVLERGIAAAPASPELRVLLVDHLLRYRKIPAALTVARAAQAALPDRPDVQDALGRALLAAGDSLQAMKVFVSLASQFPNSAVPLVWQVEVLRAKGDLTGALQTAMRAYELSPSPKMEGAIISLALRAKLPERAQQFIQDLKKKHPDAGRPYVLEGDLLANAKKWDAALAAYRAGSLKSDPGQSAIRAHASLLQLKRSQEGQRLADEWLRLHPRDASFIEHLGDVALHRGDGAEAERWYRQAVAIAPDRPFALNNLAWALVRQGKPEATKFAELAVSFMPENDEFLDTLGAAWLIDGKAPKAQELLKLLVERAPTSPTYRLSLIRALLKTGDKEAAREQAGQLAKLTMSTDQVRQFEELRKGSGL